MHSNQATENGQLKVQPDYHLLRLQQEPVQLHREILLRVPRLLVLVDVPVDLLRAGLHAHVNLVDLKLESQVLDERLALAKKSGVSGKDQA